VYYNNAIRIFTTYNTYTCIAEKNKYNVSFTSSTKSTEFRYRRSSMTLKYSARNADFMPINHRNRILQGFRSFSFWTDLLTLSLDFKWIYDLSSVPYQISLLSMHTVNKRLVIKHIVNKKNPFLFSNNPMDSSKTHSIVVAWEWKSYNLYASYDAKRKNNKKTPGPRE